VSRAAGVVAMPSAEAIAAAAAATKYARRGWLPIPVDPLTKRPLEKGWTDATGKANSVDRYISGGVGVVLGGVSGGIVDVDVDAPEARRIADLFLPETACVFGRPNAPDSHRLYYSKGLNKTERITNPKGGCIVEIRSSGGQTVMPPTMHKAGRREWVQEGEPARVEAPDLVEPVRRMASAAMIASAWTNGRRHEIALALAGTLLHLGMSREDARDFMVGVCVAADDEEQRDRVDALLDTDARVKAGGPATGLPKLESLVGAEVARQVLGLLAYNYEPDPDVADEPLAEVVLQVPWVKFDVLKFLSSPAIAPLSLEQVGAVVKLLAHAWHRPNQALPDDPDELAIMTGISAERWNAIAPQILKRCCTRAHDGGLRITAPFDLAALAADVVRNTRRAGRASAAARRRRFGSADPRRNRR
jgi:hypothetical protein